MRYSQSEQDSLYRRADRSGGAKTMHVARVREGTRHHPEEHTPPAAAALAELRLETTHQEPRADLAAPPEMSAFAAGCPIFGPSVEMALAFVEEEMDVAGRVELRNERTGERRVYEQRIEGGEFVPLERGLPCFALDGAGNVLARDEIPGPEFAEEIEACARDPAWCIVLEDSAYRWEEADGVRARAAPLRVEFDRRRRPLAHKLQFRHA
eukprot:tig00000492_g1543.t1